MGVTTFAWRPGCQYDVAATVSADSVWGESKGCLIKGCLNSPKFPKVGIPKAGVFAEFPQKTPTPFWRFRENFLQKNAKF